MIELDLGTERGVQNRMVCVQRTTTTRVTCFDFWTYTAKSAMTIGVCVQENAGFVGVSSAADKSRSVRFSDNRIDRSNPDPAANETLAGDLITGAELISHLSECCRRDQYVSMRFFFLLLAT